MNTFMVSEVSRGEGRLPATTLETTLKARSDLTFEAAACNLPDLVESSAHGFLAAVHTGFDQHRPLVLSPDDLWLCLAQGFAAHVNQHAEALRGRLVSHEGKVEITVRRDDLSKGRQRTTGRECSLGCYLRVDLQGRAMSMSLAKGILWEHNI